MVAMKSKDHDIKVKFTTREGLEKAYLIKKYFDPVVQKDMWDVLVFHQAELRTKIARSSEKGQRYIESIITRTENE